MSAALATRCPRAVVQSVEVVDVVDGTNTRARALLRYSAGEGPPQVFVKIHGSMRNRLALVALGALGNEAKLFGASATLPLEHPIAYAAAFDPKRLSAIVVIEDITVRFGEPNDVTAPLSVEQARSGLQGLARLHAAYWDKPLPAQLSFVQPWRLGRAWAPVSAASLANGLRKLRSAGRDRLIPARAGVRLLERQFRASAKLAGSGPQTLLHGDPHPGNTYALPGEVTGFYDWQLIRTGNWSHDVGYFIGSTLDPHSRRAHERELLREYLDTLANSGVTPPDFDTAWERYRATPAFGLCTWLHTYSAGSFQPDATCLATIERFATAYEDLDTGAAPVLSELTQ